VAAANASDPGRRNGARQPTRSRAARDGSSPEHYYPVDDLDPDLLSPAEPTEAGAARWDVGVAGRIAAAAVTACADLSGADGGLTLNDFVAVDFAAMDRWFEEDDPVYGHLRDPYHRVDVRASSRRIVVRHQGQIVAESSRPKLLFETGNPIRYYLPFAMWTWADSNSVTPSPNAPTRATGCTGTSPSTANTSPTDQARQPPPPPTVPTRQIRRRPL